MTIKKDSKEKFESQWHEVFAAGTHTASDGSSHTFTGQDVERIASVYNSQSDHEAPIVIGHPKTDDPAYGWIDKVKAEGGKLYAKFKDTAAEFVDLVKAGRFKKKSIKLNKGLLVHVGFLGAVPPAVSGLKNASFAAEVSGECFEFASEDIRATALQRILRSLRDFVIDKYDVETADRILPAWDIDYLVEPKVQPEFSEPEGVIMGKEIDAQIAELTKKLEQSEAQNQTFASQVDTLKEENASLKKAVGDLSQSILAIQDESRQKEFSAFVDGLIGEGRVAPAERETCIVCMNSLANSGEAEFADGQKKSRLDAYKEQLKNRPVMLEFGDVAKNGQQSRQGGEMEFAGMNVDQNQMDIHTKAKALAETEKIPYKDAVTRVMRQ